MTYDEWLDNLIRRFMCTIKPYGNLEFLDIYFTYTGAWDEYIKSKNNVRELIRKDNTMNKSMHVITSGYIPKEMQYDTKFDKFMKGLHKTGLTYSEWQKTKYPVKARYKYGREQEQNW